jgi:hypothetical protein
MIQRVMPDLMGMKNILVINDEAHHCCLLGLLLVLAFEVLVVGFFRLLTATMRRRGSGFPAWKL